MRELQDPAGSAAFLALEKCPGFGQCNGSKGRLAVAMFHKMKAP